MWGFQLSAIKQAMGRVAGAVIQQLSLELGMEVMTMTKKVSARQPGT